MYVLLSRLIKPGDTPLKVRIRLVKLSFIHISIQVAEKYDSVHVRIYLTEELNQRKKKQKVTQNICSQQREITSTSSPLHHASPRNCHLQNLSKMRHSDGIASDHFARNGVVAEWLSRQPAKLFPFGSVSSNLTNVALFFWWS